MTEEEAKTKACFRAATFAGSQQIADGPGPHCIASGCMAWRWDKNELRHPDSGRVIDVKNADTGYCGLVGHR